jgi:hypothetical protein
MHMPSDRPGMIMRKRLLDLLRQHDEEEKPSEHVASLLSLGADG